MDTQAYLKKFTRAVRWRLSKPEADEVLADYGDMLSQRRSEDDDKLVQELGDPVRAVRLLTEPKGYLRWLAVFALMAVCLLWPETMLLRASFPRGLWRLLLPPCVLLAGTAMALVWFRPRREEAKPPLPRPIPLIMAALLLGLLAAGGVLWSLSVEAWTLTPPGSYGLVARWTLWLAGSAGAAAGLWGLVQARLSDHRWRALYVLGLTVLTACAIVLSMLTSMDLTGAGDPWWAPYAASLAVTAALGGVGTGVSLC